MNQAQQMPTKRYVPAIDNHFPRVNQSYPIDVSIARKSWVTLYPTNHDSNFLRDSFVEFTIDSEPGSFIDYNSFNIEFNLQLLKANDEAVAADTPIIFTNGLLHALISSRKLFLNSQLVESDYQANYTQYVKTITSENNDYITNQCESMGYFPESKIINTTATTANFAAQEANVPIRKVYAAKENIQLYGPLNLDIGNANMLMIDRINGRLHIELSDTTQLILKANDHADNYKIKIFSVKLHYKRITPVEAAYLEFNKTLLANNIEYNFERFILHKSSVSANQRQVFLSQIFGSLIPNKLHIMMVDQTACIGDATRNAQYFDHFNLDDINIIANGLSVLNTEVSFTNKYSGLYKRVTEAMRTKDHSISYKKFAN